MYAWNLSSVDQETGSDMPVTPQAESTLNQLLTCMDGLVTRESGRPVVVIAATNRPEDGDMTCCSCALSM